MALSYLFFICQLIQYTFIHIFNVNFMNKVWKRVCLPKIPQIRVIPTWNNTRLEILKIDKKLFCSCDIGKGGKQQERGTVLNVHIHF